MLCVICDVLGIIAKIISHFEAQPLQPGSRAWEIRAGDRMGWREGRDKSGTFLHGVTVPPNGSWHLVSLSKQILKQVKLTLIHLRTALKTSAGLNRALSLHAHPGGTHLASAWILPTTMH